MKINLEEEIKKQDIKPIVCINIKAGETYKISPSESFTPIEPIVMKLMKYVEA